MRKKVVVIGAGASGVFASIIAAKHASVTLLERGKHPLTKVKISGGGRCNVTHACFNPQKLATNYPRGGAFLAPLFKQFGPKEMLRWLNDRGVVIKKESDGRMFPQTDSSQTIIDALLQACHKMQVEVRYNVKVKEITADMQIHLGADERLQADKIILATGSAPGGYTLAKELGHQINTPIPSLFSFNCPHSPLLDLSGLSVPDVEVRLGEIAQRGALLLTHWGFSGPAILKSSAFGAKELFNLQYHTPFFINWIPHFSKEALIKALPKMKMDRRPLPKKLWQKLLQKGDIATPLSKTPREKIEAFAQLLQNDRYTLKGKTTYKQEFVTCGGIPLEEVNPNSMESQKQKGLYFCGELLDIDGITGGFNFQNAWTTGYIAGESASQ